MTLLHSCIAASYVVQTQQVAILRSRRRGTGRWHRL